MFDVSRHIVSLSKLHVHVASVLKMIANLLPEDRNHIVGGSVVVNGVDSRNREIIWPVRTVIDVCSHSVLHALINVGSSQTMMYRLILSSR